MFQQRQNNVQVNSFKLIHYLKKTGRTRPATLETSLDAGEATPTPTPASLVSSTRKTSSTSGGVATPATRFGAERQPSVKELLNKFQPNVGVATPTSPTKATPTAVAAAASAAAAPAASATATPPVHDVVDVVVVLRNRPDNKENVDFDVSAKFYRVLPSFIVIVS